MRLLVVGAGATGGYLGARLAAAGQDVTFLVRPRRAKVLREHGLRVKSPLGDIAITPRLVTADALAEAYDAILLGVKGYALDAAIEDMAGAVGNRTLILPVLNGMAHMQTLAAKFGPRHVVGGALKVATVMEDDGLIVQLNGMQDFAYGEWDGEKSERIALLDAFLQSAPIGARLSVDIAREMWEKWLFLASLGAITCLMRGTVGDIARCTWGSETASALFDEALAVVRSVGVPPSAGFVDSTRAMLTDPASVLASSMYRDLQRGRDVEVENIVGDLQRHAQQAGVATPLLSAAYVQLRVYQNARNENLQNAMANHRQDLGSSAREVDGVAATLTASKTRAS